MSAMTIGLIILGFVSISSFVFGVAVAPIMAEHIMCMPEKGGG